MVGDPIAVALRELDSICKEVSAPGEPPVTVEELYESYTGLSSKPTVAYDPYADQSLPLDSTTKKHLKTLQEGLNKNA